MNYWIIVDNQPAGPYTGAQLVDSGLRADTLVWRKGYADWVEAGRVPELMQMMQQRDAATPPQPPVEDAAPLQEAATPEPAPEPAPEVEQEEVPVEIIEITETPASEPVAPEPVAPEPAHHRAPAAEAGEQVPPCPPVYVAWSVIATVLCCVPLGVAAIIVGSMVKSNYYKGNYAKAKKYSEITQWLIIATIVCGLIAGPFQMAFMAITSAI